MKKSRLLGAVCTCLLTASMSTMANAGTVGISGKYSSGPNFGDPGWSSALGSGQAQIYDTEGTEVGRPIPTSGWNFDFDTGTAELIFGDDIFSDVYFHNITFTDNNDGTYSGSMLWDWGPHINQPFDILWEITNNGNNTISIVTIDGNGDGIPGIPIPPDSSAFPGFSWALDNASLTAVPILPSVDIEKLTNGIQADEANDPDVPNIAQGMTVTWTYEITNTGDIALGEAEIIVTDNQPGVLPVFNTGSDTGGDMILSPGEIWTYTASAQALDLKVPPAGVTIVQGCNNNRNTYQNIGRAEITSTGYFDEDFSHYCNPTNASSGLEPHRNVTCDEKPAVIQYPAMPITSVRQVVAGNNRNHGLLYRHHSH